MKENGSDKKKKFLMNYFFYIVLILNVLVVGVLFFNIEGSSRSPLTLDQSLASIIRASEAQFSSEGVPLDLNDFTDSLFFQCIKHDLVFVLRIGDKQCDVCVSEAIMDFMDIINKNDFIQGLFLASYNRNTEIEQLKKEYKNIVVMRIDGTNLPIEYISSPYMFIIDKSMKTDMVFLHQKEFPEKTEGYFAAIKKRFSEL